MMRRWFERLLENIADRVARKVSVPAQAFGPTALDEVRAANQATQRLLMFHYQDLRRRGLPPLGFRDVELRAFSQNGEDGILLYLFSLIGFTNRRAVEICAGDGVECNTANLIVNHGFRALLLDGDANHVAHGEAFYAQCRDTCYDPPVFLHRWVTRANVNAMVGEQGFDGPIDLLSLDLDGVDYWIWQALDCVEPRVVVLEYQPVWGPEHAVTVPYRDDFALDFSRQPFYCGASLAAFVKLGRAKGYRLVGCNRQQFNAFFLRAGVGEDVFPEVPAARCLVDVCQDDVDWGGRVWERV